MDPQTAAKRRVNIAISHMNKGQMTEAKQNLEIAKKYDSDSPYVKLSYADYYQRVGEDQHAEELYRELVSRNPENIGDVYNSYANFLCSKDRFTEAYETFGKAVKIPSYANISGVYVNASACAHHQKNYSLSLAYIDKAIDYDGASPELFAIKAQLALDAGDMPTARPPSRYSTAWPRERRAREAISTKSRSQTPSTTSMSQCASGRSLWRNIRTARRQGNT